MEEFRDSINTENQAHPIRDDRPRLMNGHVFTNRNHRDTFSNDTDYEMAGSRAEQMSPKTGPDSFHPHRMLFILTAAGKDCVKRQSQDLSLYLQPDLSRDVGFMADLAFTLAERRSIHDWRLTVSASSVQELKTALENGDVHLNRASVTPGLGFIFTGQGAQWPAMGQELIVYPVFASALREADDCIRSLGAGWSLIGKDSPVTRSIVAYSQELDEITRSKQESNIHHAHISQPATTAIQIAIVMLLRAWNIKPSAVLGHSSGEIAAAFSAGILDLGTCMRIAYHRGSLALKLKQEFPNLAGGMLAIGASLSEAQRLVDKVKDAKVVIACMNGPSLVTVSGDREGILQVRTF